MVDNLLGFDFYGSGNIGDDLMLDGFLGVIGGLDGMRLRCIIPDSGRIATLARRFPAVEWTSIKAKRYRRWVGVGDTPIQCTSGRWSLNRLRTSLLANNFDIAIMVGVGVEGEAVELAAEFAPLLRKVACIGTRDEYSADMLIRHFGCSKHQVVRGEDLAHLSPALHTLYGSRPLSCRKYSLGAVICGGDGLPQSSLLQFRRWLAKDVSGSVAIVANEVRPLRYREIDLHRRWTNRAFWNWAPHIRADLLTPDYWRAGSVGSLIEHFSDVQCVLSSRYHGVLTAAWLGCRVAAIARGSKVATLARDLGIPFVGPQFRVCDLDRVHDEAHVVEAKTLNAFADRARASVEQIAHWFR